MAEKNIYDILRFLRSSKKLHPYIEYIRFPYYKNLDENLQINFDFPLTAIVGQNGTNKSALLRAIFGCPNGYNVGNFWFSTKIDPISEDENRPRFIYSYYQQDAERKVEVIKQRIQYKDRTTGEIKPDYWEPSRPAKKDGMQKMPDIKNGMAGRKITRWKLMEKNVILMDFRS